MDKNKDGVVTLDEFLLSCQEVLIFILRFTVNASSTENGLTSGRAGEARMHMMKFVMADYSAVLNVFSTFALQNVSMFAQTITTIEAVLLTIYYYLLKASYLCKSHCTRY